MPFRLFQFVHRSAFRVDETEIERRIVMVMVKFLVLAGVLACGTAVLAACSSQPADRTHICSEFNTLGKEVTTANGIDDNDVFDTAGTLSDLAGRYQGTADLQADAAKLHAIADSGSTTVAALIDATGDIATFCDQTLGLGGIGFGAEGFSNDGGQSFGGNSGSASSGSGSGSSGGSSSPQTTNSNADDESSALAALRQEAQSDRPAVEQLAGQWVPQLSSKALGTVADGITYDYQAIWQNFQNTKNQYSDALLLWSGDYSSFTFGDYWVTIVPIASTGGAQANAWCDSQDLTGDQCFAKLISHTAGPAGSSLPR